MHDPGSTDHSQTQHQRLKTNNACCSMNKKYDSVTVRISDISCSVWFVLSTILHLIIPQYSVCNTCSCQSS